METAKGKKKETKVHGMIQQGVYCKNFYNQYIKGHQCLFPSKTVYEFNINIC